MKKIFYIILWIVFSFSYVYWQSAPWVNCIWLPWCPDSTITNPKWAKINPDFASNIVWRFTIDFLITFMKYVSLTAVISLMFGWIMYILSWWEEEKVKKAKTWIIWSMAGVFMSVSAWWIIRFIANLKIS